MPRRRGQLSNLAHKRPDSGDLPAPLDDTPASGTVVQICCICNKMRDEQGHWSHPGSDGSEPPLQTLSHGYCPSCAARLELELGFTDSD